MEFAVVLPLIVLLLVGSIEAARGLMVSHSLQEAAQAGCRVYSVEGTTQAQATALIDLAMSNAGVTGYSITYDPAAKAAVDTHMEPVEVTITVPFANVAWLPPSFLSGATLQGNCVMPADMDISDGGDQNGYSDVNDDNEFDGIIRVDDTKDDD